MVQTTKLQLPLIAAAQAQKHVTHNEAILKLDGLAQMTAKSYTTSAQPAAPADGDLYLLPAGKTGSAWGGYANHAVAHYYDGVWHQYQPSAGWIAYIVDTARLVVYNGTSWSDVLTPSGAIAADGSVSAPGFAYASDTNTGLYRIGADNMGAATAGSLVMDWKAAGNTQPLQPAFLARLSSTLSNVTGDGTTYGSAVFDTEIFDQGGNYNNGTGVFTAPVTGRYFVGFSMQLQDLQGDTFERIIASIITSNRNYNIFYGSGLYYDTASGAGNLIVAGFTFADMDAGDTYTTELTVYGGTKTVDIVGGASPVSFIYGFLVC